MTDTLTRDAARETMTEQNAALTELLRALKARGYRFVTPSPNSHRNVVERTRRAGADPLRDLLGWSLPVRRADIPDEIREILERGGALAEGDDGDARSRYRVSSEGDGLYLHSAWPTDATDSVFFGPDSYRFAAFIRRNLDPAAPASALAEIGAGSGVGALTAAALCPGARVVMTDINPAALRLAKINAEAAGVEPALAQTPGLSALTERFDLIVANPPYLIDPHQRAYRHGGGEYGAQIALDWAADALAHLVDGGRLLLYSGAPVVDGEDVFRSGLEQIAGRAGASLAYEEIDPDVWGEELARADYATVERIAVAGAVLTRA